MTTTPGINILLVDDDLKNLMVLETILDAPDHRLIKATTPEQALMTLMTEPCAAIILDVQMPGMSGIELVTLLRSRPRYDNLPIMVITGNEDIPSIDAAYAAGATAFMCKPVNWRLLSHQVRFMVRAHRALMAVGGEAPDHGCEARQ